MAKNFVDRYLEYAEKKSSYLCVGLDPAIPKQRKKNVIPSSMSRIEFIKKIITDVSPYTSVIKINRQYVIGLTVDEMKEINDFIHENNMLSITDHKLGDIGSTNASAIYWFKEEGFDAFTFSPFAGNIEEATKAAHEYGLGIIVLTLMSNPEAIYQKSAIIEEKPLYLYIAQKVKEVEADGCVIGATGHITKEDIANIRRAVGDRTIALVPGVGAQGGSADSLFFHFGAKTMVNVGRAIIYSENPAKEAEKYQKLFNEQQKEVVRKRVRF
ncbi:MAG: orotidine-5'-phosphate decarboxylase [Candidatus Heimdallarchaeaceae archaeon]